MGRAVGRGLEPSFGRGRGLCVLPPGRGMGLERAPPERARRSVWGDLVCEEKLLTKGALEAFGHHLLLLGRAVVLEREDDRECAHRKGHLGHRLAHSRELDLCAERVPVCDDRLIVRPVPAVELERSAPLQQEAPVHVHVRAPRQLVLILQVRVVRGRDPIPARLELGL
jgi:hypothetical protein